MASKRDNRRMVDMLERMGMIKKDEDNVSVAQAPESVALEQGQIEPDPGAVLPATTVAMAAPTETAVSAIPATAAYATDTEKSSFSYAGAQTTYEKRTANTSRSALGDSFWDDALEEPDTVERYMEVDELYQLFQMQTSGVDTVYLLEEYIKTLPDSLPADLRRSIIVRIVQASGFDFDRLLADGIDRVSKLNDYASEFAVRTDTIVTQQNETIAELERQIELVHAVISERKNLHKKQFLAIENEAQRLKKILDFITK